MRNNKTSIIFTLAVSFLLFSASYFKLLAAIIEKVFGKIIGADIYAFGYEGMINEVPVADYLDGLMASDDKLVTDYAFTTWDLANILNLGGSSPKVYLQDSSQFDPY